jgi:hypothetical protein
MTVWERNLGVLSAIRPDLAARVRVANPSSDFRFVASKTGLQVPIRLEDGKQFYLNSRYDPLTEARRLAERAPESGAYLLLGCDGAYLARALLSQPVELVFLVFGDLRYLRLLLEVVDLAPTLSDPRFQLIVGPEPGAAITTLLASYIPFLHGDLTLLPVGRDDSYSSRFKEVFAQSVVSQSGADLSTQGVFGRRWMKNIATNASRLDKKTVAIYSELEKESGKTVHVTAAGPSLESAIPYLAGRGEDSLLVATDTSLPSLLAANLVPDFVISVDCQNHSYHHFLAGVPSSTKVVLDLASPNLLYRVHDRVIPVAGGHPFARLLVSNYYPFPEIDTSGGNVTHAAVSFSLLIGAREVIVHGADFSYPQGKLYARGTYCYPLFLASQTRTDPLQARFAQMLMGQGNLGVSTEGDGNIRYTTGLLSSYRAHFESFTAGLPIRVVLADNKRETVADRIPRAGVPVAPTVFPRLNTDWQALCEHLLSRLSTMEFPMLPANTILHALNISDRNILTAVMPLAAYHYRHNPSIPASSLLRMAAKDAESILRHSLA